LPQEFGELCKEYRQKYYNDIIPTIIWAKSSLF
jgi:hypothetical protein